MSKFLRPLVLMSLLLLVGIGFYDVMVLDVFAQGTFGVGSQIVPGEIVAATGGEESLIDLVRVILNYFLGFLGILCLAIIIYGGFMYVTAGINEAGAETGKKVLMYAAIGIIVILLSFVIVNTLLQAATPGAVQ